MQLLYDGYNPVTARSTTIELDAETGLPVITSVQNTTPILERAKQLASNFDPYQRKDMTHVMTIPAVMWRQLVRLGIAQDPVAFRAWCNSREARLLRTDDGRKL
jgi:hypothetical protein